MTRETPDLLASEVRFAVDEAAGTLEGYAVVWDDHVPTFNETVRRGAFSRSLVEHGRAGTRPVMLWAHNPREIVGVWTSVSEDERGLKVVGRLITETSRGAEARALLLAGGLSGLSIGFSVRKAERDTRGVRVITDADLAEISLVAFPASPRARVVSVRSAGAAALTEAARRAALSIRGTTR
ncbi:MULTISPECIES: HK97 family phage prohead protease [Hyphomicrobiales]|uniref:HK97 family phage prohead protease n=1 Tax=Hyphomicrobiales TaxID=356 RepID=UPI001BCB5C15|nr:MULTISPECIES: HK97 family phage prohead protease [Hyphomicrobiales]CAH1662771.1 conserved hypothetical protein [Hyphomicrobiales bacterium]MBS7741476.1 HK97 family phage prohead protease [Chelatococcus sp. HY11]MBX3491213.1 HK97 family phage prohead protease [Parvibaculum sp.]MBX3544505.1 HK97 family phage prohead protease [Chelatococcus sp.]MCO5078972.1 HK97 family phage prohead protease [Chelatococcus sp.]